MNCKVLRKVAIRAERERLNGLQITEVGRGKLLGLHYSKLPASLRHVQDTLVFARASERWLNRAKDRTQGKAARFASSYGPAIERPSAL